MCTECGQHQIDFVRRDSERLFRHGERIDRNRAKLLARRLESEPIVPAVTESDIQSPWK